MRVIIAMTCVLALAACGGSRTASNTGSTRGATGPISTACLAADRERATPVLCSCVQRVANAELSNNDRRRMVPFFADPEVAHATKISDTPANDAFWARYQDFVRSARRQCG